MTDQDKLGNVIKALELCTSKIETRTRVPCEICPYHNEKYHGVNGDGCCNMPSLQRDMLALLKAQEPRVMTLGEVVALQEGKGDVWIEETAMPGIPHRITAATLAEKTDWRGFDALWFSNEQCYYATDYNLNTADGWRCWTSRPTDEQREAVKWG